MAMILEIRTREGCRFEVPVGDTLVIGRQIFPAEDRHISRSRSAPFVLHLVVLLTYIVALA